MRRKKIQVVVFKKLFLIGFLLILSLNFFNFLNLNFSDLLRSKTAYAAAVSWDGGGGNGLWETNTNWSNDAVPTGSDDVTIDNATVTLSSGQTANFSTINVGSGTNATNLILQGNIGTGGSITIANNGTLTQKNTTQQTITGTLTVQSGGILNHTTNTNTQAYVINFSAATITLDTGSSVNVDGKGYSGGASAGTNGNGPAGGFGIGSASSNAGGGGQIGNGGNSAAGNAGGTGYCDINSPATIGAGGGANNAAGGNGGGLIILNATGTITINGTITADGTNGAANSAGGGGGGGVKITTATIAGTPQSFTVTGGNGSSGGGGGGGGCAFLSYSNTNSVTGSSISMTGGTSGSGQRGGAGVVYIKQTGTNGDLFSTNSGTNGAGSYQGSSSVTANSLTLSTSATYTVPSGKTLVLNNASPLSSGDGTGTLQVLSGGTFTPPSNFTISNGTLEIESGSTITSSSSVILTIGINGILSQRSYTAAGGTLTFSSITGQNTARITHVDNSTAQTHVVNLSATTITLDTGSSVDVDGKGYDGGGSAGANGNGPDGGFGTGSASSNAGGGAQIGNGGNSAAGTAGGTGYCDINSPATIGAGGGANNAAGGNGGGLAILNATGTITINGTITADGTNGASNAAGGGGGGGIKITANTIAGSPQSFTVTGGNGAGSNGGGGGGGCVLLSYTTTNSISGGSITMNGGTGSTRGGAGAVYTKQSGTDGDLYSINGGSGAETNQTSTSVRADSLTMTNSSIYSVPSSKTLILDNNSPFSGGDNSGTLKIKSGATFTPSTTFTVASAIWEVNSGSTITSGSSIVLTIASGGTLTQGNYTADGSALTFSTVTVQSGGNINHLDNTTAQTHVIKLDSSTMTLDTGGSIDVDGRGFRGGLVSGGNGSGTGSGTGSPATSPGGGAHGGNGGAGGVSGGTAYCNSSDPATLGSGGGANSSRAGGDGGGLIILNVTNILTINGTVTADGINSNSAGGAGGGIKITAGNIEGTPQSFTITGGNGSGGGGGGGGCSLFTAGSSTITSGMITATGGTGSTNAGGSGVITITLTGPTAPTTLYANNTDASAGSSNPITLTTLTPVFSAICNTSTGQCITAKIEVDNNSDFSSPVWQSSTLDIVDVANAARSGNITYVGSQLNYNTTYYWRIRFQNAGANGAWSTETATFLIPRKIELYTFNYGGSVQEGQAITIQWGTYGGGAGETIKIEYSTNNFTSATSITASTASVSDPTAIKSYSWTVPTANSVCGASSCNTVKIRITSNADTTYYVTSENNFTIQGSSVTGLKTGRTFGTSEFFTSDSDISFTGGNAQYANPAWYNSSWTRRKAITITNNIASTLTNFQVSIPVTYDSDMQADFDDLRFTSSDTTTLIDHWLQTKTDSVSATVWVEVPSIAASSTATIYMYYGNSGAASASSIANTFVYGDDFSNAATTSGNWTKTGDAGRFTVTNGTLYHSTVLQSSNSWPTYTINGSSFTDGILEAEIKSDACGNSFGKSLIARYTDDNNLYTAGLEAWGGGRTHIGKRVSSTWTNIDQDAITCNTSDWYSIKWTLSGTSQTLIVTNGGTSVTSTGTDSAHSTGKVGVGIDNRETAVGAYWDNFRVRKYAATEPSVSTASEVVLPSTDQNINFTIGHNYTSINTFAATTGGDGTVKFQVSPDNNTNWKYCLAGTLTAATLGFTHASTAAELTDSCLASLTSGGTFNVKGILRANAGQTATLSDLSFTVVTNSVPTSTAITPSQTSASIVRFTTTIADVDLNTTSLTVQYSTDNSIWTNATLNSVSEDSEGNGVILAAGSISGIDTNNDGSVNLQVDWSAGTDVANTEDSTVYIRITPYDGTANGSTVTSSAFALDTRAPTAPGNSSGGAVILVGPGSSTITSTSSEKSTTESENRNIEEKKSPETIEEKPTMEEEKIEEKIIEKIISEEEIRKQLEEATKTVRKIAIPENRHIVSESRDNIPKAPPPTVAEQNIEKIRKAREAVLEKAASSTTDLVNNFVERTSGYQESRILSTQDVLKILIEYKEEEKSEIIESRTTESETSPPSMVRNFLPIKPEETELIRKVLETRNPADLKPGELREAEEKVNNLVRESLNELLTKIPKDFKSLSSLSKDIPLTTDDKGNFALKVNINNKLYLINKDTGFEFFFSLKEAEKKRAKNPQNTIVLDTSTDLDQDGLTDLLQITEKQHLFAPDVDEDGFTATEEIFFGSSLNKTDHFEEIIPRYPKVTNLSVPDSESESEFVVGSSPLFWVVGQIGDKAVAHLINKKDQDIIIRSEPVGIDAGFKAAIFFENISDGEYYLITSGSEGIGKILEIKVDKTVEKEIKTPSLENNPADENSSTLRGETTPGSLIYVTWQSLTLNSVVIADASAGAFRVEPPKNLAQGDHKAYVYVIDKKKKIASSASSKKLLLR